MTSKPTAAAKPAADTTAPQPQVRDIPTTQAVAVRPTESVAQLRPPAEVMLERQRAAQELIAYMDAKPDKVVFNGKRYLENDDWMAIGAFYGCTAQLEADRYVQFGEVCGFEATYIVTDRTGRVIGRETSMCLNDEERWSARPKYIWMVKLKNGSWVPEDDAPPKNEWVWTKKGDKSYPEKKKERGEDVPVPLFQLRSMSHTRARSRALSSVFGFIPTMLGQFRTTPAEELPQARRVRQSDPDTSEHGRPAFGPEGESNPFDDEPIEGEVVGQATGTTTDATTAATAKPARERKKDRAGEPAAAVQAGKVYKGDAAPACPGQDALFVKHVGDPEGVRGSADPNAPVHTRWPVTLVDPSGKESIAYIWHMESFASQVKQSMLGQWCRVTTKRNPRGRIDIEEMARWTPAQ